GRDEGRREEARRQLSGARRLLDPRLLDLALPLALGLALLALGRLIDAVIEPEMIDIVWQTVLGVGVGVCLYFAYGDNRPVRFGLGIAALAVAGIISSGAGGDVLYEDRSFFGVYRVSAQGGEDAVQHTLSHGSTNHGAQLLGQTPPEPITYYHRTGPIGQLLDALPTETRSAPIAAIGLGTGSMACHAQPGQQMTFYEIDPLVEQIARDPDFFSYLRDCPGEHEVVLGDARLQLADAPDGEYGVIVADAFSSDAIPVHLMTREAIDLYLDKLREDGAMAIHISNRHLELEPVLGDLARDRGLACYAQFDVEAEDHPGKFASHWVAMAREPGDLGGVPNDGRWQPCATNPDPDSVWSDDFSNLLGTLNWG
ncbi:MAG: fused MFS/spermidine synthase, partial [Actinomycetota bacterium]|nr:fused MFS/spermidine synthase [Actinomycetota bacterium]